MNSPSVSPVHRVAVRKVCRIGDADATVPEEIPGQRTRTAYAANVVRTSKYNVVNFIPKFLFEQFKKLANAYFLLVSLLEMVPSISITGGVSSNLPVLILVLFIEAIAQIAEDIKRHRADAKANATTTRRFDHASASFVACRWRDLRCGDVVKVFSYETFPADMVALFSSNGADCYVETKSLDGETNLKLRSASVATFDALKRQALDASPTPDPTATQWAGAEAKSVRTRSQTSELVALGVQDRHIRLLQGSVCDCQDPCDPLTSDAIDMFSGKVVLSKELAQHQAPEDQAGTIVNEKNICLRGCVLRNTDYVYGVIVATGPDTKIMKSATEARSKASDMDRAINRLLLGFLAFLLVTCAIGTALGSVWRGAHLWWSENLFGTVRQGKGANPSASAAEMFGQLFIYMSQMIPIALYVTMKLARLFQTYFMQQDAAMVHTIRADFSADGEEHVIPTRVRTLDLNDDIGQISYVFSDKTGTLTQNIMEFRKCSIAGVSYGSGTTMIGIAALIKDGNLEEANRQTQVLRELEKREHPPYCNLIDNPERSILEHVARGDEQAQRIRFFFKHLALCHSVSVEDVYEEVGGKRRKTGQTRLSASSPDEQALVAGAKAMGFNFVGDDTSNGMLRCVRVGEPRLSGEAEAANLPVEKTALLDVLEFTSKRKRMSVIVHSKSESGTEEIRIYTKGADNVIFERLSADCDPEMREKTTRDLASYAADGLRTLAVATAVIPRERYVGWKRRFNEVLMDEEEEAKRKAQMPNRIDDVMGEIEMDLQLIGATAIEDKLQEGVPQAVADLARAGIKVWVLTGDKQETAINIGFATQLLRRDMDRHVLNGLDAEGVMKSAEMITEELRALLQDLLERRKNPPVPVQALVVDGKALDLVFGTGPPVASPASTALLQYVRECGAVVACRVSPLQKAQMVDLVKRNERGVKTLSIGDGANDVPMIQTAHVGVGISGQEGLQAVNASDYAVGQFRFMTRLLLVHGRWNYIRMSTLVNYMFYKNVVLCMVPFIFMTFTSFSSTETGQNILVGRTPFNAFYTGIPILLIGVYDRDVSQWMASHYPRLYRAGPASELFNGRVLTRWVCLALLHSLMITFVSVHMAGSEGGGALVGLAECGFYTMFFIIAVVNVKLIFSVEMWHWWIWVALILFALISFPVVFALYEFVLGHTTADSPFPGYAFANANFWLSALLLLAAVCIPDLLIDAVERRFFTTFQHIAQEAEQEPYYAKELAKADAGLAEYPVSERLDNVDARLWASETAGDGSSSQDAGTGQDFSMDTYTSIQTGNTFRTKIMEKSSILSLLLEEGAGASKRALDEARSTGKLPGLIKS